MFGSKKKNAEKSDGNKDSEMMMAAMKQALDGNYIPMELDNLDNPEFGKCYNKLLDKFVLGNNQCAMRLNDSMRLVGNATIVKEMLESVFAQATSFNRMRDTSKVLGEAINNISLVMKDISKDVNRTVDATKSSVDRMSQSIKMVDRSCEDMAKINAMVQTFKENTDKIDGIIRIVKGIADQTDLLSLNASIEAARAGDLGKGFGVVANEVKNLAESTSKSTEDIEIYIQKLQHDIDEIVRAIGNTSSQIKMGNQGVEQSIDDVRNIYEYVQTVGRNFNKINEQVNEQDRATAEFIETIHEAKEESNNLFNCCNNVGEMMFQLSRSVDATRTLIAREASKLSLIEWIDIYQVDHLIYTWRLFNHIYGYEKLDIKNVSNSNGCKLGKWYNGTRDVAVLNHPSFNQMKKYHELLHKKGTECFNAVLEGNRSKALERFSEATQTLNELTGALERIKEGCKNK